MKTAKHWEKVGLHSHHGISLPLFSIRGKKSCGVGEFLDLIPLMDWCQKIGFDTIQLLPICDSGHDPSPYNAQSSCALDPIYLSLHDFDDQISEEFSVLNQSERLKREEVKRKKLKWLYRYFEKEFQRVEKNEKYQKFIQENRWLENYALFKTLKEEFKDQSWDCWPKEYQHPKPHHFESRKIDLDFHRFLQYLSFEQMSRVKKEATKKGILIKGDIPFLLSPDSADVWAHQPLFNLDLTVGAPPDAYNSEGQSWGFPLFNWEAMRESEYSWWRQRLKVAERYFHLYRIDHVVGLFRIWAIPKGKKATHGFFIPDNPELWECQGKELLEMFIHATELLPIAEDLGRIPKEVGPILKNLGICGTKVIRWQRENDEDSRFIPFDKYEPFSMTTISTHDMDPLDLWWKKFPQEAISFAAFKHWGYDPILSQIQRFEILHDSHHTSSYFHINLLGEYLALYPELVWPDPESERINIPGKILPTNWTYRFRPHLEAIISHEKLEISMKNIRNPYHPTS